MRVLHLIEASSPQANAATLALLASGLEQLQAVDEQVVVLLGGDRLVRQAESVGIRGAVRVGVPLGRAVLGWAAIRSWVRRLGRFDLVHCWSVGAVTLAAVQLPAVPRVLTLTVDPGRRTIGWLRVLLRETGGRTAVLPISATIRGAVLGGGVLPDAVHVLRPGIDRSRVDLSTRSALRAQWGAASDHNKVMALLGDPIESSDALAAGMAVIMADDSRATAGQRLRLLVHPDQANRLRLQTMVRRLGQRQRVIQDAGLARPWSVLPGCDLALALGLQGGGLSLLWAMSAGVPIVGEATYAVSEIVEDHHSALLAQPDCPKHVAWRITQLLGDAPLAWRLKDTAGHEAYSFFSCQRYRQALGEVYGQVVAGREVQVPPMEATGGLRFAGRA